MAVSMVFYSNFSKKDNSTKQPTGGTNYNVVFKDAFSILGGTVKLQVSFDTAQNYTAAKYETKYYKVTDVVSLSNGIVEVSLSLDELATYKTNIAGYNGLIERAPALDSIDYIPDNTISNTGKVIKNKEVWNYTPLYYGEYCFQIKSNNDKSIQCYYLSPAAFAELNVGLLEYIFSNPTKYVSEINVVPLPISMFENIVRQEIDDGPDGALKAFTTKVVHMGNKNIVLETNTVCAFVSPMLTKMFIDMYPLAKKNIFTYNDARKIDSQYTKLSIFLNDMEIPIDSTYNDSEYISVINELDLVTLSMRTDISIKVSDGRYSDFKSINFNYTNIGIPFLYSNTGAETAQIAGSLVRTATHVATSNPVGLVSELGNLAKSVPASCTGSGSGTIHSMEQLIVRLVLTEYASTDKNPAEHGYPYYKTNSISLVGEMGNQTGFYKFVNPQVPLAALDSVRNKVNSYLASGIYYE